jgi:type II secretory pathway pseudopilin PulG
MSPVRFLLTNQLKGYRQAQKTSGFTLIELLVAMVLAFLVITPLLGFVVNILETDRKEQAKANSEQEIKAALDYIAQDLQQAVYIYDWDGLDKDYSKILGKSGIKNQIPPKAAMATGSGCSSNSCIPVLVFWKREQREKVINKINPTKDTVDCPKGSAPENCDDAYVYSLVGYYLIADNLPSGNTWSSAARIARFKISDGVRNPIAPTTRSGEPQYLKDKQHQPDQGFKPLDLRGIGNLTQKMNKWQKDKKPYNFDFGSNVLIDYVDRPTPPKETTPAPITCDTRNPDLTLREQRVPSLDTKLNGRPIDNFYACVNSNPGKNYAKVYLRGNALARIRKTNPPPTFSANNSAYFPTLTIQIQGNGFLYTR